MGVGVGVGVGAREPACTVVVIYRPVGRHSTSPSSSSDLCGAGHGPGVGLILHAAMGQVLVLSFMPPWARCWSYPSCRHGPGVGPILHAAMGQVLVLSFLPPWARCWSYPSCRHGPGIGPILHAAMVLVVVWFPGPPLHAFPSPAASPPSSFHCLRVRLWSPHRLHHHSIGCGPSGYPNMLT